MGAYKVYTYCINLDRPTDVAEYKCDCYKKKIEFVYDLELHKIEVCRGWYNYMMTEKTILEIFKILGYDKIEDRYIGHHWQCEVLHIPLNTDLPLCQYYHIYEVFNREFLIKATQQQYKFRASKMFAHVDRHCDTIEFMIRNYIRDVFLKSKINKKMPKRLFWEITREMSCEILIKYLLNSEEFKIPLKAEKQ